MTSDEPTTYASEMRKRFPGFSRLFMDKCCPHHFFKKNIPTPKDCTEPCTQCWMKPYCGEEYR